MSPISSNSKRREAADTFTYNSSTKPKQPSIPSPASHLHGPSTSPLLSTPSPFLSTPSPLHSKSPPTPPAKPPSKRVRRLVTPNPNIRGPPKRPELKKNPQSRRPERLGVEDQTVQRCVCPPLTPAKRRRRSSPVPNCPRTQRPPNGADFSPPRRYLDLPLRLGRRAPFAGGRDGAGTREREEAGVVVGTRDDVGDEKRGKVGGFLVVDMDSGDKGRSPMS